MAAKGLSGRPAVHLGRGRLARAMRVGQATLGSASAAHSGSWRAGPRIPQLQMGRRGRHAELPLRDAQRTERPRGPASMRLGRLS